MPAPMGNQYYKIRTKDGRDRIFETPEDLIEIANNYFQWAIDNPMQEQIAYHFQGFVVKSDLDKMRAFSIDGFCIYAQISKQSFRNYELNEDFLAVITRIREIVETQQFEGATSGLLNANIISRKLGLSDKTDLNVKVKESEELDPSKMTTEQIRDEIRRLENRGL